MDRSFAVTPGHHQEGDCCTHAPDREVHLERNMQRRFIDRERYCNDHRDNAEKEAERNGRGERARGLRDFHLRHSQAVQVAEVTIERDTSESDPRTALSWDTRVAVMFDGGSSSA
jgi:hypothetical protein